MIFEGTAVAMVTPFLKDGSIDEEGFRQNINWLIERDVDGLVAAPTTGESATLSHPEHQEVIKILVDEVDGRVTTIAGTGSNATDEAISLTKAAEDYGADMTLLITPYYNKPQQHGVIAHYQAIADATDIDMIAYNVPSRTGLNLTSETIVELAKIDAITAIKEADSDVDKSNKTMKLLRDEGLDDEFVLLSGNDERMVNMVNYALDGNFDAARDIHFELFDIIKALFIETSPVPAKEAMTMMGLPAGPLRLPLVPLLDEHRAELKAVLEQYDII